MNRLVTWILSAIIVAATCCCSVAQYHHHDADGHPCLCMSTAAHGHGSHGHEPHSCKRMAMSLTADSQQRYAHVPVPAQVAVVPIVAECPAEPCTECRHVCRGACCAETDDGSSHAEILRGPPTRV